MRSESPLSRCIQWILRSRSGGLSVWQMGTLSASQSIARWDYSMHLGGAPRSMPCSKASYDPVLDQIEAELLLCQLGRMGMPTARLGLEITKSVSLDHDIPFVQIE